MPLLTRSDLRDATRGLLRAPVITASAILCLGLGLGSTAAISSAIERALLDAPPYRDPSRLVTVYRTTPHFKGGPFSAPNYTDLARNSHQLSDLAAFSFGTALLTQGNEATQVSSYKVTGNLFPMLGARAEVGRLLTATDDGRDQPKVAVLSDELWHQRFAADRGIVGRTILLDGEAVTVVGVTPRDFRLLRGAQVFKAQVWIPLRFSDTQMSQRTSNFLPVLGRLAPGASVASSQHEMDAEFNQLVATYPGLKGESIQVVPLMRDATSSLRTPLTLMLGAVCMVLLIAVTDVAAMLLARSVFRRRDTAIRSALGGNRWAVVRPLLIEGMLLSLSGVVVGLLLAWAGVRTIGALAGERLPQLAGLSIDVRVAALAIALAVLVGIACSAAPALRSASVDPQDALRSGRGGGTGRAQHRMLGALVVAEVALSLILLVGAGLVMRGFSRLVSSDPGFIPDRILTLNVTVSPAAYPQTNGTIKHFLTPALAAIDQVPGVVSAGSIQLLPYQNWGWNSNIRYEGQPGDNPAQKPLVEIRIVDPEFFRVTQQRLIHGRTLLPADDDRDASPYAVVVNQALADRDFKGQDPIGKRFYTGDTTFGTIVGVVSNIRNVGPYRPPAAEMYSSYLQNNNGFASFPVMIRTTGADPTQVAGAVRRAIRAVDPLAAVTEVQPMNDVIASSVGQPRFYLTLLVTFAGVAIVLAVAGLYGVMSYSVAQRTRELGIRNALGSSAARSVRLVASQGATLVGLGVVVGLAGAAGVTNLLSSLLYGVSPLDPKAWIAASALLIVSGTVATVIPALRASRADPLLAMRADES
jgi:putative ABC transport system permease protein